MKYIFFDIDGTLTESGLTSWDLITIGLGLDLQIHHNILEALRDKKMSLQNAIDELSAYWISSGHATKSEFKKFAHNSILRTDAQSTIKQLKTLDYSIILLSGSLDIFAAELSSMIGADGFATTSRAMWEKENFKSFYYGLNQGELKLQAMQKFLNQNKCKHTQCVMVGNGSNDIESFNYITESFCLADTTDLDAKNHAKYVINSLTDLLAYIS